jgi:vancomycin resistance protein YoaR
MRSEVFKNFDTDFNNLHTLNSKYWDAKDRMQYVERSAKRAKDVAEGITRRDAVAARFAERTGLQINLPQSRDAVMRERRSMNEYSNFIRSAEKRGAMNRSISDARKELHEAEKKLRTYTNTEHIGTSKQYEQLWTQKHTENVRAARKRLNDLLAKRAA